MRPPRAYAGRAAPRPASSDGERRAGSADKNAVAASCTWTPPRRQPGDDARGARAQQEHPAPSMPVRHWCPAQNPDAHLTPISEIGPANPGGSADDSSGRYAETRSIDLAPTDDATARIGKHQIVPPVSYPGLISGSCQ